MPWIRLFQLLLVLVLAMPANALGFFHVTTSGPNSSLIKFALVRSDFLPADQSARYELTVTDMAGREVNGALVFELTRGAPQRFISSEDLLTHFDVAEGDLVHVRVSGGREFVFSENPLLPCENTNSCALSATHLMVDRGAASIRTRLMGHSEQCDEPGTLGFFNKPGNTRNQSLLLIKNGKNRQQLRIGRNEQFDDPDKIALVRLAAHEAAVFTSEQLSFGGDARVIKTFEPVELNSRLVVDQVYYRGSHCASWVRNGQSLNAIRNVRNTDGTILFYLATDNPDNQPLLNLFGVSQLEGLEPEIVITARTADGLKIPGQAVVELNAAGFDQDKVMLTLSDLRFGNAAKGVSSTFGADLVGVLKLDIAVDVPGCDVSSQRCSPFFQYLLYDDTGAVRDMSIQRRLDPRDIVVEPFFNRASNQAQVSHLLLFNGDSFPVQVLISDTHQDLEQSAKIVTIPAQTTRVFSAAELENRVGAGSALLPSEQNRQLKLVPLSSTEAVRAKVLLRDTHLGQWRNMTVDDPADEEESGNLFFLEH